MNNIQKSEISHLRAEGFSYSQISVKLSLSKLTVKGFDDQCSGTLAAMNSYTLAADREIIVVTIIQNHL